MAFKVRAVRTVREAVAIRRRAREAGASVMLRRDAVSGGVLVAVETPPAPCRYCGEGFHNRTRHHAIGCAAPVAYLMGGE